MSDAARDTTYGTAYDDRLDDVRGPGWEEAAAAGTFAAGALAPADAPLAPDDVAGNLRRYARWQWRDFWQRRGFWMAGAALLGVWVLVHWMLGDRMQWTQAGGWTRVPPNPEAVAGLSHLAFAVGGVLAGLLGAGGLIARERERGLQRFLFAKPVNALRYYLQGYAINAVGAGLVLAGAVALAALTAGHALAVGSLLAVAAAGYVLGSGATFLLSTLVRYDAPLAGAYLAAGFPVIAFAQNGYGWARAAQWLFPHGPAMALAQRLIEQARYGSGDPSLLVSIFLIGAAVAAVWGLACLAAGVAVLRRRSIQT